MAKVSPAADPNAFVNTLEQSSIISPEALAKAREAAEGASDPKAIARELLKEGELTRWQAGQLLHGYSALVVGKYELMDQIGAGELGRVYLAEHVAMNRRVAMKVLSRKHTQQPAVLKRFLADAERASALDHRNLVHVYDVNQDGERYFLVMEYVEGQDLQKLVEKSGPLPAPKALDYARQMAEGLQHAHEKQVFHGDLKPTNVLVDAQGLVKVLDLGVGKLAATSSDAAAEGSADEATLAARMYRAPEQQTAGAEQTALGDVFSVGATLFYLLTGKSPGGSALTADDVTKVAPDVPAAAAELCASLAAADPAERPQSMDEVLSLVDEAARAAAPPAKVKPDSSAGEKPTSKAKKPPVAKPLEEETVVVDAAAADTSDSSSFGDFSITTTSKPKPKPKPAAKKGKSPPPDEEVEDEEEEIKPTKVKKKKGKKAAASKMPLILAASIGGGVLVLGLIVTILVLVLGGSDEPTVAKADKAEAAPVAVDAASAEANPVEANPESNPVEANPVEANPAESNPVETNPAEANPVATTAPADAATNAVALAATSDDAKPSDAKAADAESSAAPPAGKVPEPPAAEPAGSDEKPKADAKKADAKPKADAKKTEPAKTKPAPAKPAPAKPKKVNPMEGFAKAVSLPPLPANMDEPTPEMLAPKELGPCKVPPELLVALYLKGGETAVRGGKQKFTLTPLNGGTALQDWEIGLGNASGSVIIAKMGVKDQKLMFQWTPEGVKEMSAGLLSNCALDLSAGEGHHVFALREAQMGEPLKMDFDKPPQPTKWTLENLPDPERVAIEVTKVEGLAKTKLDPDPLLEGNGDEMTVWTGPGDEVMILGLRLKTALSARNISITGVPQFKLQGMTKSQTYIKNKFQQIAQEIEGKTAAINQQIALIQSNKKLKEPEKLTQRSKVEQFFGGSAEDFAKAAAQANQLKDIATAASGNAIVHFRVYYVADDVQVDILKTSAEEEAPAAEEKPAKAAKK